MELNFFAKGMILGFAIAAPVGPIGILCIRRTLQYGRWSGLFSGLGAAIADTIYGMIAAFSLTFISDFVLAEQFWLRLIGGGFLFYLGWKTFNTRPKEKIEGTAHKTLLSDFLSTFLLTMTNPMTILSYIAIFAGLGLSDVDENYLHATYLVGGVFWGSLLWWLILSEGVTLFRKKMSQKLMLWINRIAGLIILGFALAAWISLYWSS